jgi:hypothetical protein
MSTQPSAADYADLLPHWWLNGDAPETEAEPDLLFPAKVRDEWKAKAGRVVAAMRQNPETEAVGDVLGMFLVEMQRTAAAEQRCKMLERRLEKLENWSEGADARMEHTEGRLDAAKIPTLDVEDPFVVGLEHHARCQCSECSARARTLVMGAPDYPHEREREFKLIVKRQAETVRPRELHPISECNYPCIVHDRDAFAVDSEGRTPAGRALNLRESA